MALAGLALALVLAGCGKKEEQQVTLNRPQPKLPGPTAPAMTPPPGAALTSAGADACAVVGAYVKHELGGDMGLPLIYRDAADAKAAVTEAELRHQFPNLKAAEATTLAKAATAARRQGRQIDCDWKALGVMAPAFLQPGGKDFIRFRAVAEGEVAVLDSFTSAAEMVAAGNRCLYRREAAGWTRETCVLTALH
jgi:hypothetical protein